MVVEVVHVVGACSDGGNRVLNGGVGDSEVETAGRFDGRRGDFQTVVVHDAFLGNRFRKRIRVVLIARRVRPRSKRRGHRV